MNITLLILGISLILLGSLNIKGNIKMIHWYNRSKVSQENIKSYGKAMGIGTIIMGISIFLTSILLMIHNSETIYYIIVFGVIIGLIIMLYAQFKYNKGIF